VISYVKRTVAAVLPSQGAIVERVDYVLFCLGLLGLAAPVFVIRNPQSILYPSALLLASTILIGARRVELGRKYRTLTLPLDPRVTGVTYLITLTLSILFYVEAGYQRNFTINSLILAMYVISFCHIFTTRKVSVSFLLLLTTGFAHRAMILFTSTLPYGNDPQNHLRVAKAISTTGTLRPLSDSKYFYAPFYHLNVGIDRLILDVPIRISGFLFVSLLLLVVPSLCIFRLLKDIWSERVGIYAVLLFISSDYILRWSVRTHVVSVGIILFSLCVFVTYRYLQTRRARFLSLLVAFYFILISTHQMSSFVTFVGVGLIVITGVIYSSNELLTGVKLPALLMLILTGDWITTKFGGTGGRPLFDQVILTSTGKLLKVGATSVGNEGAPSDIPFVMSGPSNSLTILHTVGPAFLFGLGIVGGIYWMRKKSDSFWIPFSSIAAVFAMYFFVFGGPLIGFDGFQAGRWIGYTYVLLCFIAAPSVMLLGRSLTQFSIDDGAIIVVLTLVVVLPYVALMGANVNGAPDDPIMSAPGSERLSFDEQERSILGHTAQYSKRGIQANTDIRASTVLRGFYGTRAGVVVINEEDMEVELEDESLLVLRRYHDSGNAIFLYRVDGRVYTVHGRLPVSTGDVCGCALVYHSGAGQNHQSVTIGTYYCNK
jgi:hypothetical protein